MAKIPALEWESVLLDWYPPFREMNEIWKWRGSRGHYYASTTKYLQMYKEPYCYFPNLRRIASCANKMAEMFHCLSTNLYDVCFFKQLVQCNAAKQLYLLLPTLVVKQAGIINEEFIEELRTLNVSLLRYSTFKLWCFCMFSLLFTVDSPTPGGPVLKFCTATEHGAMKQVHPQFCCSLWVSSLLTHG